MALFSSALVTKAFTVVESQNYSRYTVSPFSFKCFATAWYAHS